MVEDVWININYLYLRDDLIFSQGNILVTLTVSEKLELNGGLGHAQYVLSVKYVHSINTCPFIIHCKCSITLLTVGY